METLNLSEIVRNDMERIVAAEPNSDGTATLYRREPSGAVTELSVPFKPWLLLATPSLAEDMTGLDELKALPGPGKFKIRAIFTDGKAYEKAVKDLKKHTNVNPSSPAAPYRLFSDETQQFLSVFPMRLFGGMQFDELRRMQLDIETRAAGEPHFPDAKRPDDKIILVSLKDTTGWETCLALEDEDEKALLERLVSTIRERDPDVIEGHNIFNFDLSYIATRCAMHKVRFAIGRDGSEPSRRESRLTAGERTIPFTRFDIYGRHVVDTLHLVYLYDISHRDMDSHGLKATAKYFGVAAPDRTYVDGDKITELFKTDPAKLTAYCLDDARETDAISKILSPSYFYQTQLIPFSYQSCITRGNATRIDALLCAEYLMANAALPVPAMAENFEGALTESEEAGVFHNVWHVDVRSLYPSIIIANGLCPANDTQGVFLRILTALRKFRLAAKDAKKSAPPELKGHFDALQSTFKILINSFYGYTGFAQGTFNDFAMAAKITATGRDILSGMRDFLLSTGATVIEMDTDGIYFSPAPSDTDMAAMEARIQATLPPGIEIEMDASYEAMFGYKSKNYALLGHDGKITISGAALKSRGIEPFQRKYIKEFLSLMLHDKSAAIPSLYERYAAAITNHSFPISDFAKKENLSTSPEAYAKKLREGTTKHSAAYDLAIASGKEFKQGDAVEFYVTGSKKSVSV
ncbi:MAG: hypothetical protein J5833_07080, partial [Victivallales bacterium]|nr:hypothetical protein [Victivallales bacterium]